MGSCWSFVRKSPTAPFQKDLPSLLTRKRAVNSPSKLDSQQAKANDENSTESEKRMTRTYSNEELYPLTVMPIWNFMRLDRMRPYHEMWSANLTTQTVEEHDIIIFISHQWLSFREPDPNGTQIKVAQHNLQKLMEGKISDVMDGATWAAFAKPWQINALRGKWASSVWGQAGEVTSGEVTHEDFVQQLQTAFVWLDFFSVPQWQLQDGLSDDQKLQGGKLQLNAIDSIPYYVERATYFIVVAPRAVHVDTGEICDLDTWRLRGWCRLEEWSTYLRSESMTPLFITEAPMLQVAAWEDFHMTRALTRNGAVGCGAFTCCRLDHKTASGEGMRCDKDLCQKLLKNMWLSKLRRARQADTISQFSCMTFWSAHMFARSLDDPYHGGPLIDMASSATRLESLQGNTVLGKIDEKHWLPWCGLIGSAAVLQDVLELGRDVGDRDTVGRSAIHNASVTGSIDAIKVLLRAAGPRTLEVVNSKNGNNVNKTGFTPLIRAAQNAHVDVVQLLLKSVADPNIARSDNKRTALHQAAYHGNVDCFRLLLHARANVNLRDHEGRTALHLTAGSATPFCSTRGRFEVAKLLLHVGLSQHEPDDDGVTPLALAQSESNHLLLSIF